MRLLLTGATGFVGRNAIVRAAAKGWSVLAPVRDPVRLARVLAADGIDASHVRPLPADPSLWPSPLPADAAWHCAGVLFERTLPAYLRTNLHWTLSVLKKVPKGMPAVVLSSLSAGGPTPEGRIARSETDGDDPITFYGESKLRMERAIARGFGGSPIVILRPPMILGARDSAALQLFKMARSPLRAKPGLREKWFSFVAVEDLLDACGAALEQAKDLAGRAHYVASPQIFTDRVLIRTVSSSMGKRGFNLPLPNPLLGALSAVVDAVPPLRNQLPSLTRDRAREIFADRWVVDASALEEATGWKARTTLATAIAAARDYYIAQKLI